MLFYYFIIFFSLYIFALLMLMKSSVLHMGPVASLVGFRCCRYYLIIINLTLIAVNKLMTMITILLILVRFRVLD